jgi:DNA replication and repair protein RecF
MRVVRVRLRDFRNHARADIALTDGVTVLQGPVGAGKTNLLEAIYFGCLGRSFRTSTDREVIRFGEASARVSVETVAEDAGHILEASVDRAGQKALKVDGVRADRLIDHEARPLLCVFVPDRLVLMKGAAGVRRAHLDELTAALWPTRRENRRAYARSLAQRNSLLGRIRSGGSSADSLAGWNRELARHGFELMRDRASAVELLSPRFTERAVELGLEAEASLAYRPRSDASDERELELELEKSIPADIERGFTLHGPHRDELAVELANRGIRSYGSQGQQRLALLALLLAERDVLAASRRDSPVLLLDDVLSELDAARRGRLLELLCEDGQTLITTADSAAVEVEDVRRLTVEGGVVITSESSAPA